MSKKNAADQDIILIKKYANRRLYNTRTSKYVTLEDLALMIRDDIDFVVQDAKSGEDITRSVLTQIIVEMEAKGTNLLPLRFLKSLIGFYGHNMQGVVPAYLDHAMQTFSRNQEQLQQYFSDTLGSVFPFNTLEQVGKKNMALLEQTVQMFTPFPIDGETGPSTSDTSADPSLEAMQKQLQAMQQKLAEMQKTDKN